MHGVDQIGDATWIHIRAYAVTEIEDVAGSSGRLVENALGFGSQHVGRAVEQCGIEIAHHGHIRAQCAPGFGEIDAPVEADYIATCLSSGSRAGLPVAKLITGVPGRIPSITRLRCGSTWRR